MPIHMTIQADTKSAQTGSPELLVGLIAIPLTFCGAAISILMSEALGRVCSLKTVFGLPCPTCGSTRAFHLLLNGDIGTAFATQPLVVTGSALACAYFIYSFGVIFLKWPRLRISDARRRLSNRKIVMLSAILVMNWIYLIVSGH
ncbi:MAG: DUF2752 domain-containing protein [Verrucomicrobia bacterium]|nr:DUF2752 domain-containing protein [Verrucomicrobiota bacterium]